MTTFDDFDAWADAVSGASLQLACDGVERRRWTIGIVDLRGVTLQVASEGGGNLCYGASTHPGTTLFVPLTHARAHVANGEPLDDGSLLAIPRGADFRIRVHRQAHAWCSIALPDDMLNSASSTKIACGVAAVARLRRLATRTVEALLDQPGGSPAHKAAAREVIAAAAACLKPPPERPVSVGRPRLERTDIVRRAMQAIEAGPAVPTAADLARDVGVTSRTLLRTFQESFGVPPKRYLMLRELHSVRRSLIAGRAREQAVADVLVRHGIWEFGRFAARYRRQFGELPSETLRRGRG
ncbi:MAG: helix-turn-helix domain-containing protein [Planctomycetaceae bacterium]